MARPHLNVTKALPGDAGDLSALWIEWALCSGMSHDLAARAGNVARITEALERPVTTVLLARLDHRPIGFAVVNTRNHGLLDPAGLAIDELYVIPEGRRQGVAAGLLGAVATMAESEGHDLVFANVAATDKLSNRYLARLGFGTTITRRVVPTAVLRRKLSGADTASQEILLGKRRTLRARSRGAVGSAAPARAISLRRTAI